MKKKAIFLTSLISCCLLVLLSNNCADRKDKGSIVYIDNGKIRLGFEQSTGKLLYFTDIVNTYEYIDPYLVTDLPWEVLIHPSSDQQSVRKKITPSKFSCKKPDPFSVRMKWEGIPEIKGLEVEAEVTLDQKMALSYWKISIRGTGGNLISGVVFPKVEGIKELGNEKLVIPSWTGELMDDPRGEMVRSGKKSLEFSYPGQLSSQVFALYNAGKCGLYASCYDSMSYAKSFVFNLDTLNTLAYEMINYPEFNSGIDTYSAPYPAVLGSFSGDWITMSEIYREWAVKQRWVADSRLRNGSVPSWLENTALWIWNRGRSGNVLKPAVELSKTSGLRVSVLWHWWHNNSYDDNLPEYLPPREGAESFKNAVLSARNEGVEAIVYMNAIQWGESAESWKTENVMPYTVKDINGNPRSHVYNIFTGNSLTTMCMATSFWRNKYASLCDSVINIYGTGGIYMDQACLNYRCYDKSHGHTAGGGNYWVESFGKLTDQIRAEVSGENQPVLAGEGSGENWLPYLDAFLTLQASRERYAGAGNIEPIPLFQAIYHPYAITFGSYSSLVTPPYDEKWPKQFAPPETEQLMDTVFDKQFLMEQARAFVWGNQPTIANYHSFLNSAREDEIKYLQDIAGIRSHALKFLLYGEFCRSPGIEYPEEKIKISKLSIYAGRNKEDIIRTFEKKVPVLYAGTWRSNDHSIGIAIASISDDYIPLSFRFSAKDYDLPPRGRIYKITGNGKEFIDSFTGDSVKVSIKLQPRGLCLIEVIPGGKLVTR